MSEAVKFDPNRTPFRKGLRSPCEVLSCCQNEIGTSLQEASFVCDLSNFDHLERVSPARCVHRKFMLTNKEPDKNGKY
jgi:hypothetical protein